MEKPDYIEEKFRQSFSDYSVNPPDRVWDELKITLHPQPAAEKFWTRLTDFTYFSPQMIKRLAFISGATVVLFLIIIYFLTSDNPTIRGHAYAGESRLCGGTAILFQVKDTMAPLDSVNHYRTESIDNNGFFQFPGVEPGRYLLQIAPPANIGFDEEFQPSWYDRHLYPEQAEIIIISSDDVDADVYLPKKDNSGK